MQFHSAIEMDIEIINRIAIEAGKKILEVYNRKDFYELIERKSDRSPVTLADKQANEFIETQLKKHFPHIPVLSEEGKNIPYEQRRLWNEYWLVDPLDGTKEFIKRNGEFTVNIALIKNHYPMAGVIYAPATDTLYYASDNIAMSKKKNEKQILRVSERKTSLISIGSRSHADAAEKLVLSKYDIIENISIGSSLKFCFIAEGKADIYYRHGPTMEWDTAAGQAILEAAGGVMLNMQNERFYYNKPMLTNECFLCGSASAIASVL
ncbi:MAG: 3'(2'),5'-bisphosphate nucleotidase CysQ [Cytophagaceae bacterium]|nr:3'(2'),5'-bisphosphate nucleotidase CysQ [Cytophagaceae bacterium]MDW8455316.1 3'(2'),5'-bisphosphate nucleotidase CysQ [Cytophagaceae bacterium]